MHEAETWPRPLQQPIRIWHGSATSEASVDLAAKWGDPLFSANVTNPIERYAELVRRYRDSWEQYGRDPKDALVGAGSAGYYAAKNSQDAIETYRPVFEAPGRMHSAVKVCLRFFIRWKMRLNGVLHWSAALNRLSTRSSDIMTMGHEVLALNSEGWSTPFNTG
ncbi:MAG: hypothetical protein Ct9H300mP11_05130 [Chloroflexota bacterium]|nr:MAG: hypothetical protein Ct9H300mP11_05130 [Chloroflexota bacterium]